MKMAQILWNKYLVQALLIVAIITLLTGCGQTTKPTAQSNAPEKTIALPTRASTLEATPTNTRVLSIESLTPAPTPTITPIPDEAEGVVVEVLDGHTIAVVMKGDSPSQVYVVRYLGIETPSLNDPWGAVAYETNRKLAGLKVVRLVRDKSKVDDEGRLLRYVYVGHELLSIILTEQGLARAAINPPDTRFETELLEAEARAKDGKLGIWGGAPPTPIPTTPSPESRQEGTAEPTEITPPAIVTGTVEPVTTEETPNDNSSTDATVTTQPTTEGNKQ
jgi:endonuclease YncB( thermonuclease family)